MHLVSSTQFFKTNLLTNDLKTEMSNQHAFEKVRHYNTIIQEFSTSTSEKKLQDLRVCFVHTPMSSVSVQGRDEFWFNFDKRYYAVHPNLTPVDASVWELPHWIPWLGGVLKSEGFKNIKSLSLYPAVNLKDGIDYNLVTQELNDNPADVYLYSPMTPNLHNAYDIASLVKKINKKSMNVFGGVIATPLHTSVALHPSVDFVVRDEENLHCLCF